MTANNSEELIPPKHNLEDRLYDNLIYRIRYWMKETYPDLNSLLVQKFEETERLHLSVQTAINKWMVALPNLQIQMENTAIKNIERRLKEIFSDDFSKFETHKESIKEIESMRKSLQESIETLDNKLKSVNRSSSVFEDLYLIKDEMKILSLSFDRFKTGLSKMLDKEVPIANHKPISDYDMSIRLRNALGHMQIETVGQFMSVTDREWKKERNIGLNTIKEIKELKRKIEEEA